MRLIVLLTLVLFSCNVEKEAQFVIKNIGEDVMTNVYIKVKIDSLTSYESAKIEIAGKSQARIIVSIPNEEFHQEYSFAFTRLGKETIDDYSSFTKTLPTTETFMIEQQLDTVWVSAFHVNY